MTGGQAPGPPSPPDAAGRLLGRLSVLPALLAMAWLLAGLPLLLAGRFTPVLMLRGVGAAGGRAARGSACAGSPAGGQSAAAARPEQARTPWWAVAGVVAVAAAFGVDQLIYHSQQIIVPARPGVLYPVRELDRPPRLAADPAGPGRVRRHPPAAPLRQPRLLPGRHHRGAAVHGGPADGRSRPGSGPGGTARRWPSGRCSGRARCSPSAAWPPGSPGPRWAPLAALVLALSLPRAVHQPVDLQRAAGADPVPRRALPGRRLAGADGARPG